MMLCLQTDVEDGDNMIAVNALVSPYFMHVMPRASQNLGTQSNRAVCKLLLLAVP